MWLDPLVHLPWGLYRVYSNQKYVGAQISFPSKSDCECLHLNSAVYAYATIAYRKPKNRGAASRAYTNWRKEKRAA